MDSKTCNNLAIRGYICVYDVENSPLLGDCLLILDLVENTSSAGLILSSLRAVICKVLVISDGA
jgi:hypothetical protein